MKKKPMKLILPVVLQIATFVQLTVSSTLTLAEL